MDPFSGAGTTCLVAAKMGRNAIGIEMKQEYQAMAAKRIKADMGMLVEVTTTAQAPEWGE
jgi:DNA modification methylase